MDVVNFLTPSSCFNPAGCASASTASVVVARSIRSAKESTALITLFIEGMSVSRIVLISSSSLLRENRRFACKYFFCKNTAVASL